MDDSELDRLFGKENIPDKETPDEAAGASDSVSVKETAERSGEKAEDKKEELSGDDAGGEKETGEDDKSKEDKEKDKSEEDGAGNAGETPDAKPVDDQESEDKSGEKKVPDNEDKQTSGKPVQNRKVTRREPEQNEGPGLKELLEMIPLSGKSILVIALALAVVIMVVLVMFLPAFRVRNTHVEGNVVISDQEILKAAGLEYNAHLMSGVSGNIIDILRLDYGKTEQRIKKDNPYIEDIRITIKLPSTVNITVKERSKVCYIRTPDGYAALDTDGIVLELSSSDSGKKVQPVICGLNVKYAELGKPVKIDNVKDYKKAIIVLGAILAADNASVGGDYSMFENTSEVRILPSGYIFLTIYSPSGNLIQIKLNGTDSIGDDMAWLLYAFNADAFDKVTVDGALDMTGDEYIFDEYD